VRFIYLGMAILLSTLVYCKTAPANEAQAALTGRSSTYQYEIPENLSADEKSWFRVFQEGNILAMGWQEITSEIMARTPPEKRQVQKIALDTLGKKIGMEWSRPNKVRKVSTSMLQDWGDILRNTAKKNPQQLTQAIASIDQEVDAVLD
ncbi:MAG: hypothetical protein JZU50_14230, partial [Desulfobulbaceae bacterium]|nr:hypothetical protein [Desulfobulbaceae bacterium]